MGAVASQITSLTIVYSIVYSNADQRKHQGSASLAFVRGIHRGPVNSPQKWPVTGKMFPFDDVIMTYHQLESSRIHTYKTNNSWLMFVGSNQPLCVIKVSYLYSGGQNTLCRAFIAIVTLYLKKIMICAKSILHMHFGIFQIMEFISYWT